MIPERGRNSAAVETEILSCSGLIQDEVQVGRDCPWIVVNDRRRMPVRSGFALRRFGCWLLDVGFPAGKLTVNQAPFPSPRLSAVHTATVRLSTS